MGIPSISFKDTFWGGLTDLTHHFPLERGCAITQVFAEKTLTPDHENPNKENPYFVPDMLTREKFMRGR